jgi:hypothetical protein
VTFIKKTSLNTLSTAIIGDHIYALLRSRERLLLSVLNTDLEVVKTIWSNRGSIGFILKVEGNRVLINLDNILVYYQEYKLTIEEESLNALEDLADKELQINMDGIPYRFTSAQIFQVLLEKAKNLYYLHHMLNFMLYFLYPKQINHVLNQIILRRTQPTC